eukprot:TRINITY_DN8769_c0_g2_i2.p1 TRINITY_DN8769_c0_g2~~TRINITY_DN8769_c0_g2_i2.p1  ORF type:complete len:249 (-),score=78.65 TRINITY_DN8769_c0_g2_i2:101-847(-)
MAARFIPGVGVKLMVAVDAVSPVCWTKPESPLSHKAFTEAFAMLQPGDKLVVYHCTNPARYPDMSSEFQPEVIMESFRNLAMEYGLDAQELEGENPTIEFVIEEKSSAEDKIRDKLVNFARTNRVDVLFLGAFGVKGAVKGSASLDEGEHRAGASAQAAVERAPCTVVVLKPSSPARKIGADVRFLVAVDGSKISYKAVTQTAHLSQSGDTVIAMTIGRQTDSAEVPAHYRPGAVSYTHLTLPTIYSV